MSRKTKQPMSKQRKAATVCVSVFLGLLTLAVLAVLILSIWINKNFFVVLVDGSSMETSLQNGDKLYASYEVNAKRGDIIIIDATENPTFRHDDGSERLIIKRLIAVEGDCVKCENGVVYLKESGGEYHVLEEPYLTQTTEDFGEVVVGSGEIFFLGDNRGNSTDARVSGCMKYTDIVGVVSEWAVNNKGLITGWENFRRSVSDFFSIGSVQKTGA